MRIIPAIDLLDGVCVRLRQGDYARATVYRGDPLQAAREFAAAGAGLLHLVDLEGARAGRPLQARLVLDIAAALPIPVEVGGGIRTLADLAGYLEHGVARAVLGSAALKDPAFFRTALARYGERIILGLDARGGLVAAEGWTETSQVDAVELARSLAGSGLREVIYTDIARDGMLSGPDLQGLGRLVRETGLSAIASGGIASLADLEGAAAAGASGAIVGKAVYDGRIDLREAILRLGDG